MTHRLSRGAVLYCAALTLLLFSCSEPLDLDRGVPERGTLGEEIYQAMCERVASTDLPADVSGGQTRELCAGNAGPDAAPTARLRALAEQRARLVGALDTVLPEDLYDDLDHFMLQLLPLYEPPSDNLPRQTRATAELLTQFIEDDAALAALERVGYRAGYRPLNVALGAARPFLAYPDLVPFVTKALDTIGEGGIAEREWNDLLTAAALDLATAEASPVEPGPTTLELVRDLMMTARPEFGTGTARYLVQRDRRGLALPAGVGAIPAPFVDGDGDGLADVDVLGRFLNRSGDLLALPSPFPIYNEGDLLRDPAGRAIRADSTLLFSYVNVNQTMVAGMAREVPPLFDASGPVLMNMMRGLPVMMGPDRMQTELFGALPHSYLGFDIDQSPIMNLVYATGQILDDPETEDALSVIEELVREHPSDVAAVIGAGLHGDALADASPAALAQPNEFWDDMIRVLQWSAQEPGLMEALLRAIADPRTKRLGQIYGEMMRHRDLISVPSGADFNTPLRDQFWTRGVDRAQGDVDGNMSMFQRTVSGIHDLSGVRVCNKAGARLGVTVLGRFVTLPLTFDECELMELEDVAQVYTQAIIGRARIEIKPRFLNRLLDLADLLGLSSLSADALLERESGITGLTTRPTPEAMNRFVFSIEDNPFLSNLLDPPLTRDGVRFDARHDPIVFAWERRFRFCGDELVRPGTPCRDLEEVTFYEAMAPLVQAFDDFDRRTEGRFLFSEIISALHTHWPSSANSMTQAANPSDRFFAEHDDGKSYEPLVADLLSSCAWPSGSAASGECDPEAASQLLQRVHALAVTLDNIEIRPGVDGIDIMAAAGAKLIDPERNRGLRGRDGSTTTTTNLGSRTVNWSPLLLQLHALSGLDDAWEAAPEAHARWLSGRSRLVDQFLSTERFAGGHQLQNRRVQAILEEVLPFVLDRIASHRRDGDLTPWATTMHTRFADSMASATGAAALRFFDVIQRDEEARIELNRLVAYLMNEASANDSFDTMITSSADLLQVLDDDTNIVPLLQVLSEAIAPGARDAAASGGTLELDGSALDETLLLLREVNLIDDRRALTSMLQNLVTLTPDNETPLEAIIDVVAEVNRIDPGAGTTFSADDHREAMTSAEDFLSNEFRGLERIYSVIQNRTLAE